MAEFLDKNVYLNFFYPLKKRTTARLNILEMYILYIKKAACPLQDRIGRQVLPGPPSAMIVFLQYVSPQPGAHPF